MGYDLSMVGTIPGEAEALAALDAPYREALALRDSFPKEVRGTFDPAVDKDQWVGFGGTYANADPGYAAAQAEVMRLSDEQDRARRSYFRLNIWGMGRYRDVMELVGMGHWSDQPEWPEYSDFNVTSEQVWSGPYEDGSDPEDPEVWNALTDEDKANIAKYKAAQQAVLSAHPGDTPGIPLWKFGSNDGWHVTPVECSSALQIFGEWLSHDLSITWEDALNNFRKSDEDTRKVIVAAAAHRNQMDPVLVGHAPMLPGEEDSRGTQFDVLCDDYWLQWLQYLTDGVHSGGFRVH